MHSDIAVSVKNLTKTYRIFDHPGDRIKQAFTFGRIRFHRGFTALKDISFEIKKGETIGIIGRNGSGKSTLLQLICGILKPTAGRVQVYGRVCALLELGAGFNPEFTGRENVYFQGAVTGCTKIEMDARFDDIVAFADIGEFIDQPVRTYSSGMYVRLAFSVAIHVSPDILIVDEALGVGDAAFARKCFRFLNEFRKRGTLIVVSHDVGTITALCDSAIWIDSGTVIQAGDTKTVCESYFSSVHGGNVQSAINNVAEKHNEDIVDQRLPFLNCSNLRNDLELFEFNIKSASFGNNQARVLNARFVTSNGEQCSWVVGGEIVTLSITISASIDLDSVIVGFTVKNQIGQAIFGDNTYLTYVDQPQSLKAGGQLEATFQFRMPQLPAGDYSVSVAVAEGTQVAHTMLHWVHDAVTFQSTKGHATGVLLGLPMQHISMQPLEILATRTQER
ncbi:ABC transporter ATP-binding protein [Polaromonas sp. YR568]|uniref:ABC transporter ATP-binding protein n=1 Tax=Polaromonas sp. YR568 TaxID=1855301 RepID=UPI00398C0B48